MTYIDKYIRQSPMSWNSFGLLTKTNTQEVMVMSNNIYSLYKTTNLINGKIYIGVHTETKWPEVDRYLGSGLVLKQAIEKYGRKNFKREILCVSDSSEYIYFIESKMVDNEFVNENKNYNLVCGGGYIDDDLRIKFGDKKGKNNPNYGKTPSEETRRRMRESRKGRITSAESRKKMSDSTKGASHPNYGKLRSETTKSKISNSLRGHKLSPETIAKRTATLKANKLKKKLMNERNSSLIDGD